MMTRILCQPEKQAVIAVNVRFYYGVVVFIARINRFYAPVYGVIKQRGMHTFDIYNYPLGRRSVRLVCFYALRYKKPFLLLSSRILYIKLSASVPSLFNILISLSFSRADNKVALSKLILSDLSNSNFALLLFRRQRIRDISPRI